MTDSPRRSYVRRTAFTVCVLATAYPLSYAPVVWLDVTRQRAQPEYDGYVRPIDGSDVPLYKPIDWLIDKTPLQEPLFAWARLWSVDDAFRVMHLSRVPPDCILR